MNTLFQHDQRPLAERMRPERLEDLVGQRHLFARGAPLEVALRTKRVQNLILHGPPGTGKTTIARALANSVEGEFIALSAVNAGKSELADVIKRADANRARGKRTILFLDEIHRWNRTQQDALLPQIESGHISVIGATTENPGFSLVRALQSRARILEIQPLTAEDLGEILRRAEQAEGRRLPLTPEGRTALIDSADHDARLALGMAEAVWFAEPDHDLTPLELEVIAPSVHGRHGRNREALYDMLSAFHKSMRGSDPDAALLYAFRMLEGGEDIRQIIRRVQACASEDVGLADPQAMVQAASAWAAIERLGDAEGWLPLAQAIIYVAAAPKSNAVYAAGNAARRLARETSDLPPPLWMMNAPTSYQASLGRKKGYAYDHDFLGAFSGQTRLPEALAGTVLYQPSERGWESVHLSKRLAHWRTLRASGELQPRATGPGAEPSEEAEEERRLK
ncbi:putative ATPase [Deinococcus hopiensis KR-140]|uniref:Putative ATPase n=2 Tax=Deinococcus TaxID=1298 RepID=A0A1W1UNV6_9DEIO|nr:putative ATPase [Deinococcus hopiensis KR-140]